MHVYDGPAVGEHFKELSTEISTRATPKVGELDIDVLIVTVPFFGTFDPLVGLSNLAAGRAGGGGAVTVTFLAADVPILFAVSNATAYSLYAPAVTEVVFHATV